MGVTRRTLVIGGAGLLTAACAGEQPPAPVGTTPVQTTQAQTRPIPTTQPVVATTMNKFMSKARGREVTVITMAPDGHAPDSLPKCVALHGRGGDVNTMVELEVQKYLTAVVNAGTKPFAVISVDGGTDSYWVNGKAGDDPQKMLLEELGPIQAAFGISMGGFGALRFARTRRDLKAVVAISPALFRDWPTARDKKVFAGRQHWEANEPLLHTKDLDGMPLGVWCGAGDPFITVAKALIDQTRPAKAEIAEGGHDAAYWKKIMPEVLSFVGARITGT